MELQKHDIIRHSEDMIIEEYNYHCGVYDFHFQRLTKDFTWYVTYDNKIITHGQYRHDLEEWIKINYINLNWL